MRKRRILPTLAIALLVIISMVPAQALIYWTTEAQEIPYGPYLDEIIWSEESDEIVAVEKLKKGELQAYIWGVTDPAAVHRAQIAPEIVTANSYPGWNSFTYNIFPTDNVTVGSGELNPFVDREFREAINLLIDREFIVRDIVHYLGVPLWTPWPPSFPDYQKVYADMKEIEAEYPYDPYEARSIIEERMESMGAYKKAGKWYWTNPEDGVERPVTIRIFARTEDYRLELGEYLASLLDDLGFFTEIIYGDSAKASMMVMTDMEPWKGRWHVYTSGWVRTSSVSHSDSTPLSFEFAVYDPHYYYYFYPYLYHVVYNVSWSTIREEEVPHPWLLPEEPDPFVVEFFNASWRLYMKEYVDEEERNLWVVNTTRMALKHSVNTWVINSMDVYPWNVGFGNMVFDTIGGLYSPWAFRTMAYVNEAGEPIVGGTARLGNKRMFVEPWNPISGSGWIYDYNIFRCIYDSDTGTGILWHPSTGIPIPLRETFTIEGNYTPLDPTTIQIPETAFYPEWTGDPEDGYIRWVKANDLGYDESWFAVTFNFHFGYWHYYNLGTEYHVPMTLADVLMHIAFEARMGLSEGEDPIYESGPAYYAERRWFPRYFRGVEVINETAIKVYFDFYHLERAHIAEYADDCIWPVTPWEVMAVMISAREDERLAFSSAKATELGVPWMDYAKDPETIGIMAEYLESLSDEDYFPPFLNKTRDDVSNFNGAVWGIGPEDATARWEALNAWYNELGHFMVSNGPYYLENVDIPAKMVTLKAHRGYPFKADHFNYLVAPAVVLVEAKTAESVPGLTTTVEAYVTKAGVPYGNVTATFYAFDPEGNSIFEKDAEVNATTGRIWAELTEEDTAKLKIGMCRTTFFVKDEATGLISLGGAPLLVKPVVAYTEEIIRSIEASLSSKVDIIGDALSDMAADVDMLEKTVVALRNLIYATLAVAIISILVTAYGIGFLRRPPKA